MSILSIKSLYFEYHKQLVLEDINLDIKQGDFLAIIGPNGGGKSTLLKLITGLLKPTKGQIVLDEKKLGYVPQKTDINQNFPIKVWEVVSLGENVTKKLKSEVSKVLEDVDMQEYFNSNISKLSGGQRQRVMIARALFSKPKLLLLDEPTSSIDPKNSQKIYELLKKLNKDITIIVVSHDLAITLEYANKIAYINKNIFHHDKPHLNINSSEHFCEVELMQMLEGCRCKSC